MLNIIAISEKTKEQHPHIPSYFIICGCVGQRMRLLRFLVETDGTDEVTSKQQSISVLRNECILNICFDPYPSTLCRSRDHVVPEHGTITFSLIKVSQSFLGNDPVKSP